jgi:hypothetical protein
MRREQKDKQKIIISLDTEFGNTTLSRESDELHDLYIIMEAFEDFLKAAGFRIGGYLDIVEEDEE